MLKPRYFIVFSVTFFIFLIGYVGYINYNLLLERYIEFSKKDAVIEYHNNKGQLNGKFISFKDGKKTIKASFKNGLLHGWVEKYHINGRIKNRALFKENKNNGRETEYYENGQINYTVNWKNDKRYGSEYHYLKNGRFVNYAAFDIGNVFFVTEYIHGKPYNIVGRVISPNLYTISNKSDILISDGKEYLSIKDLYIPVATPPELTTKVYIRINDKRYFVRKASKNTILIKDAFSKKRRYNITIAGQLLKEDLIIKKDSIKHSIKVI